VIQQYSPDKQKAPQSLDDLIKGGYIREIPKDPFTGEANWTLDMDDVLMGIPQAPGIGDVHSASSLTASDGIAYCNW
jgi:general secretion pathway protein G